MPLANFSKSSKKLNLNPALTSSLAVFTPKILFWTLKGKDPEWCIYNHSNLYIYLRLCVLIYCGLKGKQYQYLGNSWTWLYPAFANSVDPDQLASEEANWFGSALFVIQYMNLYQQSWLSNLIGWQLEMGVAS